MKYENVRAMTLRPGDMLCNYDGEVTAEILSVVQEGSNLYRFTDRKPDGSTETYVYFGTSKRNILPRGAA